MQRTSTEPNSFRFTAHRNQMNRKLSANVNCRSRTSVLSKHLRNCLTVLVKEQKNRTIFQSSNEIYRRLFTRQFCQCEIEFQFVQKQRFEEDLFELKQDYGVKL